ncbi:unnamed protein product [Camellia sinensis]
MMNRRKIELGLLLVLACAPWCIYSEEQLLVKMTLVQNTSVLEAYCLDGSLPAYHLHRGFGAGARNWLLQFEGGGWCNDIESCLARAQTHRGSTRYMNKLEVFSGILTNNASLNPEGNLVNLGVAFLGLPKWDFLCFVCVWRFGKALKKLRFGKVAKTAQDFYNWNRVKIRYCDGASFAGDATFDNGTSLLYFRGQRIWKAIILDLLPKALLSGCSAGGLASFLHCDNFTSYLPLNASVKCLSDAGFFLDVGVEQNLDKNCTGFRKDMLAALSLFFKYSKKGGMFINSLHNKTIAEAVGDWYFGRRVTKEIDCAYPCDSTCHNLIG